MPLLANKLDSGAYKVSNPTKSIPPLLGAGGIMTGANMAGVLAMGADGVVVGTRMLMTPEAAYSDAQKKLLVDAGPTSTLRTMAFDEARNTLGWPKGVDGRGLINDTVNDYMSNKGGDGDARRAVYKEAEKSGDPFMLVCRKLLLRWGKAVPLLYGSCNLSVQQSRKNSRRQSSTSRNPH